MSDPPDPMFPPEVVRGAAKAVGRPCGHYGCTLALDEDDVLPCSYCTAVASAALASPGVREAVEGHRRQVARLVARLSILMEERDRLAAALARVEAVVLAEVPCRCHEAYTRRGLVAPDCVRHDVERALAEVVAPAADEPNHDN